MTKSGATNTYNRLSNKAGARSYIICDNFTFKNPMTYKLQNPTANMYNPSPEEMITDFFSFERIKIVISNYC